MKVVLAGLMIGALGLGQVAFADEPEVIYGDDDRKDLFDPSNTDLELSLAKSTAVMVDKVAISADSEPGYSRLPRTTFGQSGSLCEDEPFYSQPNPGSCSGFLVGPNILVTAGHCINRSSCDSRSFVFDFGYLAADQDVTKVANDSVYHCKQVIAHELEGGRGSDYAVIELDREVTGREPLKFRKEGKVEDGTPIVVIGHPSGLPTKIAAGANVRDNQPRDYFIANLDTYGGNSGSAVFNSETGEVEGILVRGETDFVSRGGCRVSNRCTDLGCRGEDVTRATLFAPHVPDDTVPTRPTRQFSTEEDGLNVNIPDDNEDGIEQEIHVEGEGELHNIGVHVRLTHTYVGDLVISIVHPDGTSVTLQANQGGSADDLDQVFGVGGMNVSGLIRLRGKPANGTWKLKIKDTAGSDTGALNYVKLVAEVYAD